MKPSVQLLAKKTLIGAGLLALASIPSYAGVSLSVDSTTTQASTSWSGSPAGTLAQSISTPSSQNSFDGGVSSGIIFKAGSSFTLGAVEIDANGFSGTGANGNFNIFLYDLGSSYVLPGSNPVYTFTGSEPNLLSAGLNVTLANVSQFNVFSFSGADNVSMNSGDSYLFLLTASDGISNLGWHRGPITPNQDIAVNSVVVGGPGSVLNNGGTGANRTPVAAFFAASVPEPSTFALAGVGIAAFAFRRRQV
jgi:PEP-CTERM motif